MKTLRGSGKRNKSKEHRQQSKENAPQDNTDICREYCEWKSRVPWVLMNCKNPTPYYLSDISVTSLQVSSCGSCVSLLELEAMEIANVFIQYTALISFSIPFP